MEGFSGVPGDPNGSMGARQWINDHPRIAISVIAGCCAIVLMLVGLQYSREAHPARLGSDQAFFSDDDGKTYFRDTTARLPPFDHNGKTAYGALVLRCENGAPFVAYLQGYSPKALETVQDLMKRSTAQNPLPLDILSAPPMDVKAPGGSKWFSISETSEYARVTTPRCPDGGAGPFQTVSPDDPDSGAAN